MTISRSRDVVTFSIRPKPGNFLLTLPQKCGQFGKLSKIKFYETPSTHASDAVKKALEKWKLKEMFGGGGEPTMTRTALRFHFVFESGKGRVEVATEQEQNEFGGDWGKRLREAG